MRLEDLMSSKLSAGFQKKLLFACGLCFASDGIEVTLLSFLSYIVQVEWNLTANETAWLTSSVFLGMLIGSLFWGALADAYGRRPMFMASCTIICVGGAFSGLMFNYNSLCFSRFIVGIGVGGLTIPFDILAEFTSTSSRARRLLILDYFWSAGAILVPFIAWITIGYSNELWRVFIIVCSIPCGIACVLAYKWVPESPKWLKQMGRLEEAQAIIKEATDKRGLTRAASCGHDTVVEESIKGGRSVMFTADSTGKIPTEPRVKIKVEELFRRWIGSFWNLRKFGSLKLILIWIIWFAFGFCYYGLILSISKIFANDKMEFKFMPIIISCVAELVGTTIAIILIDHPRFGRKGTAVLLYCLSAPNIFWFCNSGHLFNAFFARVTLFGAVAVTWVATPEMFPTEFRATGHGSANTFTRIGAMTCPFAISNLNMDDVGRIFAILLFIAALCTVFTEETMGKDLDVGEEDDWFRMEEGGTDDTKYLPPVVSVSKNSSKQPKSTARSQSPGKKGRFWGERAKNSREAKKLPSKKAPRKVMPEGKKKGKNLSKEII